MPAPTRFRCALVGADTLLSECGEILLRRGHAVVLVAAGSNKIAQWARSRGIAVLDPASKTWTTELADVEVGHLFSITHLSILPDAALALAKRGAFNFHDGPLPAYAGLNTPAWGLARGETSWGIRWHRITTGIDEGEVLVARDFEIAPEDTSLTLNTKCFEAGLEGFEELLDALESGHPAGRAQDFAARRYFARHDRFAAAGTLGWTRSATELAACVRALDFGPYRNPLTTAKVLGKTELLHVRRARALDEAANAAPGTVMGADEAGVRIATGNGVLLIEEFASLDGTLIEHAEVLARLGTVAGGQLVALDTPRAEALSAVDREASRSEARWLATLLAARPAAIAEAPDLNVSLGARACIALRTPAGFGAEFLAAGALAWLARRSGGDAVACRTAPWTAKSAGFEAWFAPCAPLAVAADLAQPFERFVERFVTAVAELDARGPLARDLALRAPELAARKALARPEAWDVRLELGSASTSSDGEALVVLRVAGGTLALDHDARRLSSAAARELANGLETFLANLARADKRALGTIDLLAADERRRVLADWNATTQDHGALLCIHDQFVAQARKTPDAPAVSCGFETLPYAELDARANRLASRLVELGVGPDKLVGIALDRSIDLVVAVLATHKAGGAYVPLDPAYPAERLRFMVEDAELDALVTSASAGLDFDFDPSRTVRVDAEAERLARRPATAQDSSARPEHLAYAIYTSGSTGKPKGVLVEHRNVANFFAAMDELVPGSRSAQSAPPGTWMAVTSLSFDISVLELLWTLTRGFHVVIHKDTSRSTAPEAANAATNALEFGLYFWGNDAGAASGTYELLLEAARFADVHGFSSVWVPERHFHAFGGAFPNPSVLAAAIAAVTSRVQIRAGSCVLPLHHPLRVAEEWAVVDNLSGGRVGVSFASGWQPHDFVLRPENFTDNKAIMFREIETVRRLWRGEELHFPGPMGDMVPRRTLPRPIQKELPVWITTAGNPETYREAGRIGANVLTHLLGQSLDEVAGKIRVYREALAASGRDPSSGKVTLMLHTFVGKSDDEVRELVRGPLKEYLKSSVNLVKQFAWSFPAFKRPAGAPAPEIDLDSLTPEENEAILEHAFQRYFEQSGLFGTVETCMSTVARLEAIGVDEVGALVDFGLPRAAVRAGLEDLAKLKQRAGARTHAACMANVASGPSLPAEARRHHVTHMQCTPSLARMLAGTDEGRAFLRELPELYIGGEAFPVDLARDLAGLRTGRTTNMYGPTETTIWSCTHPVAAPIDGPVPIGKPIANTRIYVLDEALRPVPPGSAGELWIAGDGVVRGYHRRPELTDERFRPDPFAAEIEAATASGTANTHRMAARMYRTGDVARWRTDGVLEFLGRADHQVKIRGHRIELGEIEAALSQHASVAECVVVAREDVPGDQRLVAYLVPRGVASTESELRDHARRRLPEAMVPSLFVTLESLPLTPNGKIDRKALPAPAQAAAAASRVTAAPEGELETLLAELWRETLVRDTVGVDDNFFDIGGHSLLVVRLHRLLKERVPAPISLTDLYRFPTIRSLAAHMNAADDGTAADTTGRGAERGRRRRELLERRRGGG